MTGLTISCLVDDQHTLRVGSRHCLLAQELEPLCLDPSLIPDRLGKKPLQLLRPGKLGSHKRFGVDQSRQRLVPLTGQEQTLQILPETGALIASAENEVKMLTILLQGCWGFGDGSAFGHGFPPSFPSVYHRLSRVHKLPLMS
jgi:hypothetical protein